MRLANVEGRAVVLTAEDARFDVAETSGGRFGPGLLGVYGDWAAFLSWARDAGGVSAPFERTQLRSPSPDPRQIFAIGLNYAAHA